MYRDYKNKAISSVILKLSERLLSTGIQVIVSIMMARILSPNAYGKIALISVFITLSNVLIESGFGVGLVQKKNIVDEDIHTVFWSSTCLSIIIYFIIYLGSPIVGAFYEIDDLSYVLRIYALSIIFSSISSVINSIVSRELKYEKQLISSIIASAFSGGVGIWMVYIGFEIWALVFQQITHRLVYMFVILYLTKYVPKFKFSSRSFKHILNFSWKVVIATMISTFFNEVRNLIVGNNI